MHQKQGEKGEKEKEKEKKQVDASEAGEGGGGETMKLDLHELFRNSRPWRFQKKAKGDV